MRWFRAVLALCISLLVVGFQAAPGPFVLCASKCEIGQSGEMVEVVCWSGPSETGCCVITEDAVCGSEAEVEAVEDLKCCVADASCPPYESCPRYPYGDDGTCPYGQTDCFYCLPGRVLADKTPQVDPNPDDAGRLAIEVATVQLAQSDLAIQSSHSHSPPGLLLAESGSDICIEICLLLI